MDQTITHLLLALALNELLHNLMEITNIRGKVERLQAYINKESYKEMPVKIDTRPKAYLVSVVAFFVTTSILFGVVSLLSIPSDAAVKASVGILILTYFITAVMVDKYHVDIEAVTRLFKK